MPHSDAEEAVIAVILRYVDGYINADERKLCEVFADDAVMNGFVGQRLVEGSPKPFIDRVCSEPPLASMGIPLNHHIEFVMVTGNAASVVIKEYEFGDFSFIDHMHLLKRDGVWKIISKTFSTF